MIAAAVKADKWQIIADTILLAILYRTDFQANKCALWQIADIRNNDDQEARRNALKVFFTYFKGSSNSLKDNSNSLKDNSNSLKDNSNSLNDN